MTGRDIRDTIGLLAVVAGLLFVGMEIRQNNTLARAAAYQAMGDGLAQLWLEAGLDASYADLQWRSVMDSLTAEDIEALSPTEYRRVWALWVSSLRSLETTWRQVRLGLLDPAAFDYFGNNAPAFTGPAAHNLRLLWPDVRATMSPDFAAFIEGQWRMESP